MAFRNTHKNLDLKKSSGYSGYLATGENLLSHNQLQQKCFLWAYGTYPQLRKLFWHTPNELPRRPKESDRAYVIRLNQRKAIGVVPGVLDLVFYFRCRLYVFDFKVGKDTLSSDQKEFIERVVEQGGEAYEIKSFEQFQEVWRVILCA